ncbi:MAG TPA: alpha/beta hydrolase [Acidimicrobiales bacterium]|nr:alpha/beta hydrolase [Acidimicrobiales bacterium]
MAAERIVVDVDGGSVVGERRGRGAPVVILLHEGVADRRSWRQVAEVLADRVTVISYDRRGYGETPGTDQPFSHVDDLLRVIDYGVDGEPGTESAWLVGTSMGGGVALDAALVAPERVAGLVLLSPGVSGAPAPELDPDTARFDRLVDQALGAGDLDEVNRLETWLWLDGPSQPEGRVGGDTRALALAMNAIPLRSGVPEDAGASGVRAWDRLQEVGVPVTVACGDLDVPFLVSRSRIVAERVPHATHRVLPGVAHLSELEAPAVVTELLVGALGLG